MPTHDHLSPGPERLCGALRSARESLCVAQTDAEWASHRQWLQEALDTIDRIGAFSCPSWSRFDLPTVAPTEEQDDAAGG